MKSYRSFTKEEIAAMVKAGADCNDPVAVMRELGIEISVGPRGTRVVMRSDAEARERGEYTGRPN